MSADRSRRDLELRLREGPERPEDKRNEFGYGDVWTWTAIDAETKLMVSWLVGARSIMDGTAFMHDVASRLAHRVQLTTDANRLYLQAVEHAYGGEVDYAQLLKEYGVAIPAMRARPLDATARTSSRTWSQR